MGLIKRFKKMERPVDWRFKDPDTKREYGPFYTLPELIKHVEAYREQNKLVPIQALKETIENYLCCHPDNAGKCEASPLQRGWHHYVRGGVALFDMLMFKKVVDQPEAERRARTCATCDNNVFPEESHFDKWADSVAEASTGARVTSLNKQLGICSVCKCTLRAKVWEGGKIAVTPEEKVEFQKVVDCWVLKAV